MSTLVAFNRLVELSGVRISEDISLVLDHSAAFFRIQG